MNVISQLVGKLFRGAPLSGDDVIALLLVLTMIASLAHLMTMLATRWGDRNTALKSLLASILVHGVCLLGLEVFEPAGLRRARPDAAVPLIPETVSEFLVESDVDIRLPESGNVPIADQPSQPLIKVERLESTSPEVTPVLTPERTPDVLESISTRVEDVTLFETQEITELAPVNDSGEVGPKQATAENVASDLQTTHEQNVADQFTVETSRTLPQTGRPTETTTPKDPSMLLAAPELKFDVPSDNSVMALATTSESSIQLPQVTPESQESIESRNAPNYSTETIDGSEMEMKRPEARPGTATTFQPRLPRPARSAPDSTPAELPSRTVPNRARTPVPLQTSYDDVRIGDIAPSFSEALESAAPLMENELPTIKRRDNPPAAYQLRNLAARRDAALKFGGTRESENSVERSLKWLAANQSPDGRWDASEYGAGQVEVDEIGVNRNFAGREADTGLTALVTLAFLGAGYTHENGRYAVQVDHALDWLIRQQGRDGNLCGNAEHYARMYCHAMATYALAEAYGMQEQTVLGPIIDPTLVRTPGDMTLLAAANMAAGLTSQSVLIVLASDTAARQMEANKVVMAHRRVDDLRLRGALSRAVAFTIGQQDPTSGGWRYKQLQEGDVSMFGWQMMSLKSAEIAGVFVPGKVRQRMNLFLNSVRQGKEGGLFGYRRNIAKAGRDSEPVTPTMTAEALFCQQMLGHPQDTPSNLESVTYLMQNKPKLSELNYYYWYYGTLAMYQNGGRTWQEWNSVVREVLISEQIKSGRDAGSWDPNDEWGRYGGRLYSTALATLTLEVYYRFLPLYRMNDKPEIKIKVD